MQKIIDILVYNSSISKKPLLKFILFPKLEALINASSLTAYFLMIIKQTKQPNKQQKNANAAENTREKQGRSINLQFSIEVSFR